MLRTLAPHLPSLAIHKHGTWVVQKCIELATSTLEVEVLVNALQPYTARLLLDPFGNYVLQCCLRLQPHAGFIFDTLVKYCGYIAQGKFGARAMRACLEHPQCTPTQKRQVAQAILMYSDVLATHVHGSLLVTWLLDCTTYVGRYMALVQHLQVAHLIHSSLGLHLLLKLVSQRSEIEVQSVLVHNLWQANICQVAKQPSSSSSGHDNAALVAFLQKLVACLCDPELRAWVFAQCVHEGVW
ncbi:hypothetical protein HMI55_005007 [Coelomomyces lativittatus]|nr:hypothetical protein HMI55_005007 [Coelomomyces lativittatus]